MLAEYRGASALLAADAHAPVLARSIRTLLASKNNVSTELIFNYRTPHTVVWEGPDLQERYGFTARYPDDEQPGQVVSLLP